MYHQEHSWYNVCTQTDMTSESGAHTSHCVLKCTFCTHQQLTLQSPSPPRALTQQFGLGFAVPENRLKDAQQWLCQLVLKVVGGVNGDAVLQYIDWVLATQYIQPHMMLQLCVCEYYTRKVLQCVCMYGDSAWDGA